MLEAEKGIRLRGLGNGVGCPSSGRGKVSLTVSWKQSHLASWGLFLVSFLQKTM